MIKTRIFQFVGHIHSMPLCIEMISFINHENESILRWFYSFVNPGILAFVLGAWSGCIQAGWGSDLWLSAVVLWNSASHVSTMLRSNLDLSDILSDIRPWYSTHPPSFGEVFSRRHRRALEKQGQKKQTKHSKQQDNTSMTVTVLVPGIRLFNFGNYCFNSSINFCD